MQKKSKKIRLFWFDKFDKIKKRPKLISRFIEFDKLTYGADYGIRTHDPLDHNQML